MLAIINTLPSEHHFVLLTSFFNQNRSFFVEFCEKATKNRAKIPRPPNAFMLYANENRKKMSQIYPTESNKDISKRLGSGWKSLDEDERKKYFEKAKAIGVQHKKEYPGSYTLNRSV